MRLSDAFNNFKTNPCNRTAGEYLGALMKAEADDRIGDDGFLNGLCEVQDFLLRSKSAYVECGLILDEEVRLHGPNASVPRAAGKIWALAGPRQ